jgi:hypothetical protein
MQEEQPRRSSSKCRSNPATSTSPGACRAAHCSPRRRVGEARDRGSTVEVGGQPGCVHPLLRHTRCMCWRKTPARIRLPTWAGGKAAELQRRKPLLRPSSRPCDDRPQMLVAAVATAPATRPQATAPCGDERRKKTFPDADTLKRTNDPNETTCPRSGVIGAAGVHTACPPARRENTDPQFRRRRRGR